MNDSGTFNAAAFAATVARDQTTPGCHLHRKGYADFAANCDLSRAAPGLPGRRHEAAAKLLYAAFLWKSVAFPDGCFLFAAFAAGLVRNPYDPGLPPGATLSRSFAALSEYTTLQGDRNFLQWSSRRQLGEFNRPRMRRRVLSVPQLRLTGTTKADSG